MGSPDYYLREGSRLDSMGAFSRRAKIFWIINDIFGQAWKAENADDWVRAFQRYNNFYRRFNIFHSRTKPVSLTGGSPKAPPIANTPTSVAKLLMIMMQGQSSISIKFRRRASPLEANSINAVIRMIIIYCTTKPFYE